MIILSDIDGPIADSSHRSSLTARLPPDWPAIAEAIPRDKPNKPLIMLLRLFVQRGHVVHFLSGRGESTREATEAWFKSYGVPYHALLLRADDDARTQVLLKRDLVRPYNRSRVLFALEDNTRVVQLYRGLGIQTLQTSPIDATPPRM